MIIRYTESVLCSVLTLLSLLITVAAASESGEIKNSFINIPAGCFQMGNGFDDAYYMEKPVHEVCLDSFSIAKYDVTVREFKVFVQNTGYQTEAEKSGGCYGYDGDSWILSPVTNWRSPGFVQDDNHPVVCVTWNDALHYAEWLSAKENRHYLLPTEAQWEYAARGGGRIERYSGGNDVDKFAWYSANSGGMTHPVGKKKANTLGIYDMSGNVWQWTSDWYSQGYYRQSPRYNPQGAAEGTKKVFRGGSWFYDARGVRVSYRDFANKDFRSSYLGFRLITNDKKGAE